MEHPRSASVNDLAGVSGERRKVTHGYSGRSRSRATIYAAGTTISKIITCITALSCPLQPRLSITPRIGRELCRTARLSRGTISCRGGVMFAFVRPAAK